jgi:hypothetical protein
MLFSADLTQRITNSLFSPASNLYFVNKSTQYGPSLESAVIYPISLVPFYETWRFIFVFKYFSSKLDTEL